MLHKRIVWAGQSNEFLMWLSCLKAQVAVGLLLDGHLAWVLGLLTHPKRVKIVQKGSRAPSSSLWSVEDTPRSRNASVPGG